MTELKPLSREAIPKALQKAERYRLLNEPVEAESICLDILAVEPDHYEALVTLLLALTDQFDQRLGTAHREARGLLERFQDDYHRAYYEGIIWERYARAQHSNGGPGSAHLAYDALKHAMEHYAKAIEVRPPGEDESILRWNTCVRILERHPELKRAPRDAFHPMLE